jgi:hypothetical protein
MVDDASAAAFACEVALIDEPIAGGVQRLA